MANKIICKCEYCGKDFETTDSVQGKRKRFCNKSCSAFWRNKTYGPNRISEETRLKNAELLKAKWKNDEFRERNIQRMKTNNPVYMDGVVAKANKTKLEKYHLPNNFKFGNGHISDYESKVLPQLASLNFYYNYAIPTKLARDAFPEKRFPSNYKPDFVNLKEKMCIEIDGPNHLRTKELDDKKDFCLNYLGFKVIRFTHNDIDDGRFDEWLNYYVKEKQD